MKQRREAERLVCATGMRPVFAADESLAPCCTLAAGACCPGFSNASLIRMACRSDGRLLQPTAPMRAIDAR
eukprot:COSAG04_NODE_809_length_10142_cov_3.378174_13_plen_71_part_00